MLERLEIDNYQCIKHAEIDFGRLTVIVGPSGRGKSTTIRALTALCFNQVGSDFIRHGQQKARVALTFDDGQIVEWEKPREKGATYGMGDQAYTRVGRAVPPDIERALGVRRIEVDKGVTWRPQFHLQFDAPLLLTESTTMAARALAQLTKLHVLVEAQIECRRDKQRAERQRTSGEEEVVRLREQLSALPNVNRARNVMDRANKRLRLTVEKLTTAKQAEEIAQDIVGSLLLADATLPADSDMTALEEQMVALENALDAITASDAADEAVVDARNAAEEAEVVLVGAEDSYQVLVKELGACPMCGSTETWGHDHA